MQLEQISVVFHQYETGVRSGTIKPGVGATQWRPALQGRTTRGQQGQQQGNRANRGTQIYQDPLVLKKGLPLTILTLKILDFNHLLTLGSNICVLAIEYDYQTFEFLTE